MVDTQIFEKGPENGAARRHGTRCSRCIHPMLSSCVSCSLQNLIDSKRKLDSLLMAWRPKDFRVHKRDGQGTVPEVRVRFVYRLLGIELM